LEQVLLFLAAALAIRLDKAVDGHYNGCLTEVIGDEALVDRCPDVVGVAHRWDGTARRFGVGQSFARSQLGWGSLNGCPQRFA
jgi:hypothetical protein